MDCHPELWLMIFLMLLFCPSHLLRMIHQSYKLLSTDHVLWNFGNFIHKLLPLAFNLNLHRLTTDKLILMKELSNGGGTFIFMGFISDHLLKYSMQTTKSLKPSTSGKLYMSIPICCITSVLMGMLWSSLDILFHFSLLLTLLAFLNQFFDIAFDLVPENLFQIFCIVESLSIVQSLALAVFESCPNPLWTSIIIVCCRSVEEITSFAFIYIRCP